MSGVGTGYRTHWYTGRSCLLPDVWFTTGCADQLCLEWFEV